MLEKRFTLHNDFIELIKLLKLLNLAESGAHAKFIVEEGDVKLNGETEFRKRAKIRQGDLIECNNFRIVVEKGTKK
jgi:ribosome-associated protein